jgi:deoxyinosine 3'endonuclease (endonuclease V)
MSNEMVPTGLSAGEAMALQRERAGRVERETRLGDVRVIAGVDCAAPRFTPRIRAVIVLLRYPELTVLERQVAEGPEPLPYIPGLLSFRELPIVLQAWERLRAAPDLVMVDGQGIAHPRRLGIAAHLGVLRDVPASPSRCWWGSRARRSRGRSQATGWTSTTTASASPPSCARAAARNRW